MGSASAVSPIHSVRLECGCRPQKSSKGIGMFAAAVPYIQQFLNQLFPSFLMS